MKILVGKIEVTDLIRAAAKTDPLREDPEAKKLLDMTKEEYDAYCDLQEQFESRDRNEWGELIPKE